MKSNRILRCSCAALLTAGFLLAVAPASRAVSPTFSYFVTLPVSTLPSGNGPFSLDLQLVEGNPGDVGNTVTVGLFGFNGGSGNLIPTGIQTYTPVQTTGMTVSGSFTSGVTLTSTSGHSNGVAEYAEELPAGTQTVTFKVSETNNTESGSNSYADLFNVFIDDNTTFPIPTQDTANSTLVSEQLGLPANLNQVTTYNSTSPDTGVNPGVNTVPEPASAGLALLGLAGLAARRKTFRRA